MELYFIEHILLSRWYLLGHKSIKVGYNLCTDVRESATNYCGHLLHLLRLPVKVSKALIMSFFAVVLPRPSGKVIFLGVFLHILCIGRHIKCSAVYKGRHTQFLNSKGKMWELLILVKNL